MTHVKSNDIELHAVFVFHYQQHYQGNRILYWHSCCVAVFWYFYNTDPGRLKSRWSCRCARITGYIVESFAGIQIISTKKMNYGRFCCELEFRTGVDL